MMNAPDTVVLGGQEYRVGSLNCFDALHVARLVSPFAPVLIGSVFGQVIELVQKSKESSGDPADMIAEAVKLATVCEPFLYRLQMMERSQFEDVVKVCLSCVERKDASGRSFGKVTTPDGVLMYSDMDWLVTMQLVIRVIVRELRPIFATFTSQ